MRIFSAVWRPWRRSPDRLSHLSESTPSLGRPGVASVFVVPVPPRVRRRLGVTLGRVLPVLLAPESGQVEVAPGAPHCLVAAIVDEVGAEHAVAVADERVRAVPFVHA